MSQYNVITLQSLSTTSDIEYRTIVCGNLLNGATFGNMLDQTTFNPQMFSLEINGSAYGNNINVVTGSVALSPYPPNRLTKGSGNTQYTIDGRVSLDVEQGNNNATAQIDQTLQGRCAEIASSIIYLSQTLSQLSPNNNATFPNITTKFTYFQCDQC